MKQLTMTGVLTDILLCVFLAGCAINPDGSSGYQRTGLGALAGGVVGGAAGALFGGDRGANAAIGAGAGVLLGGAVGNYMDRQAAALRKNLPEARVECKGDKVYVTLPSGILFDRGRDQLKPVALESLGRAAFTLRESQTDIIVEGHTDSTGTDAVNLPLSQRRADRVREFLVLQGVPASRLVAVGFGAARPAYPNDSEQNRALNRRVQLEISPNSTLKAQESAQNR